MANIAQKLVDGAGLQAAMGIMGNYTDNGDRGVVGGFNQAFPLTAATKGNIYYHKGSNRYYVCVDNYSGSSLTNPNNKFEELSTYKNRQRLNNLITYQTYSNQELGKDIYGYSVVIDHLCLIFLSIGDNPKMVDGVVNINLPYNFTKNTFATITDNDANLVNPAYSNLYINWVSNNKISYKGTTQGHTLFIAGYIN